MDKVTRRKKIVSQLVEEIGKLGVKPNDPVQSQIIKDESAGHYLLFNNGWEKEDKRVYGCYLHIDVSENGKIWLQHDGTDLIVADKLMEKGIPKSDIVLGFHAPFIREDTGFAVA